MLQENMEFFTQKIVVPYICEINLVVSGFFCYNVQDVIFTMA
jgi:hypothetical protein